MKKNILLPTDFSDNAWSAAVYALKLFANEECTFYFLNSWSFSKSTTRTYITSHLIDELKQEARKELIDLKKQAEIVNTNSNHEFQVIFSSESLLDTIETAVKEHKIDLIIMGTKGATGAKEFLLGSNTIQVVKKIKDCPVLVVPDEFDFIEPKQIAFPTDFSRFYSDKELTPLKELTALYNSKIMPVCILTKEKLTDIEEYNMATLKSQLENYDTSFHFMPNYAKKTVEITDFIEELGINILVMVNYKHSFIENLFKEPIIKNIGFNPLIPFLVIPA
ncbi:universal stress protein [Psychroserpens luteus]|uniref:Universal stress protein n=1 Tax=Psychroserpens luteus TaxID=1434066 RepID=A0ABW5ZUZ9_9FLAO|nr:universal stress protein [Psychroserpens luteus]